MQLKSEHELYLYLGVITEGKRLWNDEISVVYILIINIISKSYNVINRDLLKPVTNIASCKQYILRNLAISILASKTAIIKEVL